MHANRVVFRRDDGLFAGPVYIVRFWGTDVSGPCGPTCVSVACGGEKLCKAMPNCGTAVVSGQWSVVRGGGLIREGTRRGEKNTFLSTKGHEGPRRTPFCPRRATKDREEHPFVHEGPRRGEKNTFLSAKGREGARRTPFCPRRATKDREEHVFVHEGPRRGAKNDILICVGRRAGRIGGRCEGGRTVWLCRDFEVAVGGQAQGLPLRGG